MFSRSSCLDHMWIILAEAQRFSREQELLLKFSVTSVRFHLSSQGTLGGLENTQQPAPLCRNISSVSVSRGAWLHVSRIFTCSSSPESAGRPSHNSAVWPACSVFLSRIQRANEIRMESNKGAGGGSCSPGGRSITWDRNHR